MLVHLIDLLDIIIELMLSKVISFITLIFLLVLPFILPQFTFNADASSLLTAVSFLFAILVGFFIATTTSNYLRLQTLISKSNACLVSIYNLVLSIEPNKKTLIADAIDEYMIAALDYELLDYTKKTRKEFNKVRKIANSVNPTDEKGFAVISELHARMNDFLANDQEISLTSKRIVTPRHWLIIILLALLFGVALMNFRNGEFFVSLFIGVMFVAIYQILVLIHEIDTNLFLSKQLAFEDPQQVFQGIERLEYYPAYAIKKGYVIPTEETYRLGVYKNHGSFEKEIKIVGPVSVN